MPVMQISKSIIPPSPAQKSLELAQQWGYLCPAELAQDYAFDSLVPAICSDCDYSTEYEPDQTKGHCENCGTNTVKSILILQGII
jgi:hypothetical protein